MSRYIARGLAIVLSVASLGAAQGPHSSGSGDTQSSAIKQQKAVKQPKAQKSKPYQLGTASWYGAYFQGKPTASGEPYDMYAMTAAHPELPLGTMVKVTNLRNGRVVVLRINDRGPFVAPRIIDVSYTAAKVLDFKARGIQRVRLDILHPEVVAAAYTPVAE